MTDDIASRIVSALFDQITTDGGLIKDKAEQRVREVMAAHEAEKVSGYEIWNGERKDILGVDTTLYDLYVGTPAKSESNLVDRLLASRNAGIAKRKKAECDAETDMDRMRNNLATGEIPVGGTYSVRSTDIMFGVNRDTPSPLSYGTWSAPHYNIVQDAYTWRRIG